MPKEERHSEPSERGRGSRWGAGRSYKVEKYTSDDVPAGPGYEEDDDDGCKDTTGTIIGLFLFAGAIIAEIAKVVTG